MHIQRLIVRGCLAGLVVGSAAAQALQVQSAATVASLPSRTVLYHFVRSAAYLSRKADQLDQQDGSGQSLRRAFSSTIGLTDADAQAVFTLALQLDGQFAAFDQQASNIIANAKNNRAPGSLIPPPPPELASLRQQKIALMDTLPSTLTQNLSAQANAAIAAHFQRSTGQNAVQAASGAPATSH